MPRRVPVDEAAPVDIETTIPSAEVTVAVELMRTVPRRPVTLAKVLAVASTSIAPSKPINPPLIPDAPDATVTLPAKPDVFIVLALPGFSVWTASSPQVFPEVAVLVAE